MSGESKSPQQLTSWKEIAEHLRVAVRTAQAWEHEKGLPVRRMAGEKGRLVADPQELDQWKRSISHSNRWWSKPPYFRIYVVLSTLLLIAAASYELFVYVGKSRHSEPTEFHQEQQPLVVVDHQKSRLSSGASPDMKVSPAYAGPPSRLNRKISFIDFDGDGELEILLDYSPVNPLWKSSSHRNSGSARERVELHCAHCGHMQSPGDVVIQKSSAIPPQ